MIVRNPDSNPWVSRQGELLEPIPCRYDSRLSALLSTRLREEDEQALQRAANARAGGNGTITFEDVAKAIPALRPLSRR
jgi:hypothetical protein